MFVFLPGRKLEWSSLKDYSLIMVIDTMFVNFEISNMIWYF